MTDEQNHMSELAATRVWPNETWSEFHIGGDQSAEQNRQSACQIGPGTAQSARNRAAGATA